MNKTAQTTEYAPGWDIDNFRRTVIAEVNNGNRTHLMIRAENCGTGHRKTKKEHRATGKRNRAGQAMDKGIRKHDRRTDKDKRIHQIQPNI